MEKQAILDEIVKRVSDAGGSLLAPVKELAHTLGEKPERLYYMIRSFQDKGQLQIISRGPKGIEIRLGSGVVSQEIPAGRGKRPRAAAPVPASTGRFCPFCGRPAETNWRFCAKCGEELPPVR